MPSVQVVIEYWVLLIPLVLHGIGILFIFDVLMNGRTSQGTIAWVMALFFFPLPGRFSLSGLRRPSHPGIRHRPSVRDHGHASPGEDPAAGCTETSRSLMVSETLQIDVLSDIYQLPVMKGNRCDPAD